MLPPFLLALVAFEIFAIVPTLLYYHVRNGMRATTTLDDEDDATTPPASSMRLMRWDRGGGGGKRRRRTTKTATDHATMRLEEEEWEWK